MPLECIALNRIHCVQSNAMNRVVQPHPDSKKLNPTPQRLGFRMSSRHFCIVDFLREESLILAVVSSIAISVLYRS